METLLCNVGMFLLGVLACGIICYRVDTYGTGRKDPEGICRKPRVRFYVVKTSIGTLELWMGKPGRYMGGWQLPGTVHYMPAGKVCTGISFSRFGLETKDYTTLTYNSEPVEVFPVMYDDL